MYPHFVNFVNPSTQEHYVVSLQLLNSDSLISKYYPQLNSVHFNSSDSSYSFTNVISFIVKNSNASFLKEGLDVLSEISGKKYEGKLNNSKEISTYIRAAISQLANQIKLYELPNWNYIRNVCAVNVYKKSFTAIEQKDSRFSWHAAPNDSFGCIFLLYYSNENIYLTSNDYIIIDKMINTHGKGTLVKIMSVKQKKTTYRKTLEELLFEERIKTISNDIFYNFSLEDYMQVKYHAIKYDEL